MSSRPAGKAAFVFIFIAVLVDSIGFGIILPVLPRLIMELTGVTIDRAAGYGGWLAFVYALLQFFCAPVLGNLSDRFGRRPVLLFALFALGLDYLVMGFAPVVGWLFAGRAIAGIAGASFTPAYAYVADISPPEKRAQNFGLMGAGFGIGFILGPAIGGLLGGLGPRAPFFTAGIIALANGTLGLLALPESLPQASRRPFDWRRANPLGTLRQILKYPAVTWLLAALFLWQLGHQVLPSTWAFYTISKFRWTSAQVGYSLAFVGTVMAISQGALTRVLIPWLGGERRAASAGMTAAVIAYLGYALVPEGWMMYVVSLTTFVFALTYPSMNALASRQIPANAQGELQGAVASLYSLSSIIGPPLMTQVFGYFSREGGAVHFPGAAFLTAALLTMACGALFTKAMRLAPQPPTAASSSLISGG
ncbi:MAG TPA: TCR/Tet family MFS transporter [Steroidobacteraceae bacterium]|jgi:DHA1 family tetracycline resistance protein-like MFS transporter|nr:TCR/Tet family MFS transporter [Steroidobacteraceae bacterium]